MLHLKIWLTGEEVGMFMGGSLPKGAGLLRQLIKMVAKERRFRKTL